MKSGLNKCDMSGVGDSWGPVRGPLVDRQTRLKTLPWPFRW